MSAWTEVAARNNAEWCDVICRMHGAATTFNHDAWTSQTRSRPLYPDAVTLVAELSVGDLLARIDCSAGCSIKDSFASLDLSPHGFRVLFDGAWIVGPSRPVAASDDGPGWERVRDEAAFVAWEQEWRGDDGPRGSFSAALLDNDDVAIVATRDHDRVMAGAILNQAAGVVGISNFFTAPAVATRSWDGCVAVAGDIFPGVRLVGYESGSVLATARARGFSSAGALRVWLRDS